ncbi:MAG: hypothetical protein JNL19_10510 [Burkholderiales bacterium]|nr:hypothetical protein [Burkholderiales bacterium]
MTPFSPPAADAQPETPLPPALALVRLSIPGIRGLTPAEQLQAATLALRRELSIKRDDLHLAVATDAANDEVRIAWCTPAASAGGDAAPVATQLLAAMQPGVVYWVAAPQGYLVGERGALAIESADPAADQTGRAALDADRMPSEAATLLATASQHPGAECVFVDRDTLRLPDPVLAHWQAASGVRMRDGLLPASTPIPLVTPPRVSLRPPVTALDRALRAVFAASLLCVLIAGARFALLPAPQPLAPSTAPAANTASGPASAGALLNRIAAIAPELLPQTQNATYASGAWLLVLSETDRADAATSAQRAAALQRAVALLEGNGLAVQSTPPPTPRLRVSLP